MTPVGPGPDSSDKEAVRRWMRQSRSDDPSEARDVPATPEEFSALQRRRLLQAVEAPLVESGRRRIEVALTGGPTTDHAVPVSTLGSFLTNFQESISAVAQALSGRPTSSASIPREIREATVLSAAATYPSSFGVAIYGPPAESGERLLLADWPGDPRTILDEAVEKVLDVVDLSEGTGRSDELLAEQLAPLGPRSMKHIGALTAGLSNAGIGLRVAWYARGGQPRHSSWSAAGVQRVRQLCEQSDFAEAERFTVAGWLGSASSFRGRVEIRTDDGEIVQAGTGEELTSRLERFFNKRVEADVEVTRVRFSGGRERRLYAILELRNL